MCSKFESLSDSQRRKVIKDSLIAAGVDQKVLTDDVLNEMFLDLKCGTSRSDERPPGRPTYYIDKHGTYSCDGDSGGKKPKRKQLRRGKGKGLVVLGVATGVGVWASTADAAELIWDNPDCQILIDKVRQAMQSGDPCDYCRHIIAIDDKFIRGCGLAIAGAGADIMDSVGLAAWERWGSNWDKLKTECFKKLGESCGATPPK